MDDASTLLDEPDDPTEARYRAVARAVVEVLLARGPHEIRIATISRKSGVSRAWIYKQFGKDTATLLDFTLRELGAQFAGLDAALCGESIEAWRESVAAATAVGLRDSVAAPWAPALYFRYRHSPGVLGDAVRAIESRHTRTFVASMPDALLDDERDARRVAAVFTAARLGVFAWWAGEDVRKDVDEATAISSVLGIVDQWIDSRRAS